MEETLQDLTTRLKQLVDRLEELRTHVDMLSVEEHPTEKLLCPRCASDVAQGRFVLPKCEDCETIMHDWVHERISP